MCLFFIAISFSSCMAVFISDNVQTLDSLSFTTFFCSSSLLFLSDSKSFISFSSFSKISLFVLMTSSWLFIVCKSLFLIFVGESKIMFWSSLEYNFQRIVFNLSQCYENLIGSEMEYCQLFFFFFKYFIRHYRIRLKYQTLM